MACFHPLKGWLSKNLSALGKRPVTFIKSQAYTDRPVTIPCGQCSGCRLERSRQWAIRCHHEASLYKENSFITLTYSEENLPKDLSLDVRELQLFMKKLRKKYPQRIRFYACGEYGEKNGRPHYHLCLFNHQFNDLVPYRESNGHMLYTSAQLEKLWTHGYATIGEVTFQTAAYTARYIMKKINGKEADNHYLYINKDGEYWHLLPEFTTMSRKPGIGTQWLDQFTGDVYPDDFIIVNQKRMRPPRFYDLSYEKEDPNALKRIKWTRKRNLGKHKANNTPERLRVRETIQEAKLARLPRNHDKG